MLPTPDCTIMSAVRRFLHAWSGPLSVTSKYINTDDGDSDGCLSSHMNSARFKLTRITLAIYKIRDTSYTAASTTLKLKLQESQLLRQLVIDDIKPNRSPDRSQLFTYHAVARCRIFACHYLRIRPQKHMISATERQCQSPKLANCTHVGLTQEQSHVSFN